MVEISKCGRPARVVLRDAEALDGGIVVLDPRTISTGRPEITVGDGNIHQLIWSAEGGRHVLLRYEHAEAARQAACEVGTHSARMAAGTKWRWGMLVSVEGFFVAAAVIVAACGGWIGGSAWAERDRPMVAERTSRDDGAAAASAAAHDFDRTAPGQNTEAEKVPPTRVGLGSLQDRVQKSVTAAKAARQHSDAEPRRPDGFVALPE